MAKKSFSHISVGDVTDECGLARQTFYYHFKDKYDLMNWICYTETTRFLSSCKNLETWTDGLKDLCMYMKDNKVFYTNALHTQGQGSFPDYLHDYVTDIAVAMIEKKSGRKFDEKKWGFSVEFFVTAFVGLIVKWADNGMEEDPEKYLDQIKKVFDGSLLKELDDSE